MLGLLSTNFRGMERGHQKSATHGKIALAHEHNGALTTSTSARGVVHTSARCLGHPARAGYFLDYELCHKVRSFKFGSHNKAEPVNYLNPGD